MSLRRIGTMIACALDKMTVNHFPLTIDQVRQANAEICAIAQCAEELAQLLSAGYGEFDPRAVRAQEAHAAVQRLQWEMERKRSTAIHGA